MNDTPHEPAPDPSPADDGSPHEVTQLISALAEGDRSAGDRLLELVYRQLRGQAERQLASERAGHTLSATALVHEAYLRLAGPREKPWAGRGHFYSAAAQAMRRVLVDHARGRAARGNGALRLADIADVEALGAADSQTILAVDEAVTRLEDSDPEAGALVRLRFYAGLSVQEAAEVLDVSPRKAARLWAYGRAVLYQDLAEDEESQDGG
jgi:RNA polymerase sigma factor (TIGR02999 family)